MTIIKNEPTLQDEEVVALRKAFAQRARWMKLFIDEMKKEGMDWPRHHQVRRGNRCFLPGADGGSRTFRSS